jgi:ABC-2 type transport system permease protein
MKAFIALLLARNKEFYRDRASISWAVILPVIIIVAVSIAFSGRDQQLFKVGVLTQDVAHLAIAGGVAERLY